MQPPSIRTPRLILRPFNLDDAPAVQKLANNPAIASNTRSLPYPYEDHMAQEWIKSHHEKYQSGEQVNFAITHLKESYLIGAIGIQLEMQHKLGEMGYWIGEPHWNKGYCSEAAQATIRFGFENLNLNRIFAQTFKDNKASERILQKCGMQYEGYLRQHIKKLNRYEDVVIYAILRSEFIIQYG